MIPIIYEDNHLLAVIKPPNILSQGDSTGDQDILTYLKEDLKKRYQKPNEAYLGLIHRLDRPVGGVMLFAKTSKSASRLSNQIRMKEFYKEYLAIIHGIPARKKDILIDYLFKDKSKNIVSVVDSTNDEAKKAVLDYELLESVDNLSLIKINLHTGRSHQIRVQLSNFGHPLYGDQKYGLAVNVKGAQIALWSSKISCQHPTLKKEMVFESLPEKKYPWSLFRLGER